MRRKSALHIGLSLGELDNPPKFPTCVTENSAHAGSVILDCILSLDSGFIVDNSALHVPFCDLPTLLKSNPRVTKMLHLLAKEIHTQIISCDIQDLLVFYNDS